jgi:ApbE superfamily uncharacterized protein (UPF0280 family)
LEEAKMPYQQTITPLQAGAVRAECGPMRVVISAAIGKVPQSEMAMKAAEASFEYLERIARFRGLLGRKQSDISPDIEDPLVLKMIRSVLAVGDPELTPMAAVAGTIGDGIADFLFERGMTKVVVDNGGDVSLRLQGVQPARVGIRPNIGTNAIAGVLTLDSSFPSWGVATSGLSGRSLTRGVASAATVVARQAAMADAAATAIANASLVADPTVVQRPAEEIDPDTDIPGVPVTVKVGALSDLKKSMALSQAMGKANELLRRRVIMGAYVVVQRRTAMTDFFRTRLVRQESMTERGEV